MKAQRNAVQKLEVVYLKTADLLPDPKNARTHSAKQIEQLQASHREFGFTNPLLLRPNRMIGAGHARWLMAKAEGLDVVPTITIPGLTEEQWAAYLVIDNQIPMNAGWDMGLLSSALNAAVGAGMELTSFGFQQSELRRILGFAAGLTGPDVVPEHGKVVTSRVGDLWQLGEHRVLCGDATSATDVAMLLGSTIPALMVTDPPYGVDYDPTWRNAAGVSASARTGKVQNDDRIDWREAWKLFPGPVAYVWHAGKFTAHVQLSLEAAGFEIRSQIMWRKARFAISRSDYHWQHEPCWYAVRKGSKASWIGGRKQSTVWDIAGVGDEPDQIGSENVFTVHGTQKPVECMRRPIDNNSKAGDAIYDPFLGSGSSLIAAEQCERICFGLELDPAYVDVIVRRWQNFTGRGATLFGSQSTFEQTALERMRKNDGDQRSKT